MDFQRLAGTGNVSVDLKYYDVYDVLCLSIIVYGILEQEPRRFIYVKSATIVNLMF